MRCLEIYSHLRLLIFANNLRKKITDYRFVLEVHGKQRELQNTNLLIMKLIYFFLFCLLSLSVFCQEGLEWEALSAGNNFLMIKRNNSEAIIPNGIIASELRQNFDDGKIDIGGQLMFSSYSRHNNVYYQNRFSAFQLFIDRNIVPQNKIMPFIGIGFGTATINDDALSKQIHTLMLTPRLGFELFRFFRTTLEYRLTNYPYSHFNLRFGITFGGRVNKTKL